jgi:hypothetical protein
MPFGLGNAAPSEMPNSIVTPSYLFLTLALEFRAITAHNDNVRVQVKRI